MVIFWLVYYLFQYPRPHMDDIFFTGAAMNLVKNREFVNPYIIHWATPVVDRFYVQPPFHTISLAIWLSIWGISTQSLLLFQCVCYVTFSIFTGLTLKIYGFPSIASIFITICFAGWMTVAGLRQDALSMAYCAVGLWLLAKDTQINQINYFLGFCFMESSILCSLVNIAYILPFSLAIVSVNVLDNKGRIQQKDVLDTIKILLLSTSLICFLFLLSINFEIHRFIGDILWHSSWRRSPFRISDMMTMLTNGYREITDIPVYIFYAFLMFLVFSKRKYRLKKLKVIGLTVTFSLVSGLYLYSNTTLTNSIFISSLGIILILCEIPLYDRNKKIFIAMAATLLIVNQSWNIAGFIGQNLEMSKINNNYEQIRQFVRDNPDKKYSIDESAARFVFDYKLPENSIDWNFSRSYNGSSRPGSLQEKPADEVWIISKDKGYSVEGLPEYPRVTLFGHTFDSIPSQPNDIILIK